ncbi:MAG: hypothetical protein A2636_03215 [Elusimicrobia bacterium RIFCSPHIGHO2_01_FULL_64_10]|nr:MAG: hypothetical protein A2636_03215 [Elusimicrobia bacterium RIFCSPHIGHO2_01_FULL_64_10]
MKPARGLLVVASLGRRENLISGARRAERLGAGAVEIRIDSLPARDRTRAGEIFARLKKVCSIPLIATVRSFAEQDPAAKRTRLSEPARLKLYGSVLPFADMVDVELDSDRVNRDVVRLARESGRTVILSSHDFRSVPGPGSIRRLVKKFRSLRGDILKVAAAPQDSKSLAEFLLACLRLKDIPRAFIAMGPLGLVSRIGAGDFGSCLTYGSLKSGYAPGQVPLQDLIKAISIFSSL